MQTAIVIHPSLQLQRILGIFITHATHSVLLLWSSCYPLALKATGKRFESIMSTDKSNYGSVPPAVVNFDEPSPLASRDDESEVNNHHPLNTKRVWIAACTGIVLLLAFLGSFVSSAGVHEPQTTSNCLAPRGNLPSKKHLKLKTFKEPKAKWFHDQIVDHFAEHSGTWSNRYYEIDDHWGGPGHPIFLMNGGEDTLDGVFFPWIYDHLGKGI